MRTEARYRTQSLLGSLDAGYENSSKHPPVALLLLALCLAVGCGDDGRNLVEGSGVVTYKGRPVPSGTIIFYPEKGRPASSPIATDGSFKLSSYSPEDGIAVGTYKVSITAYKDAPPAGAIDDPGSRRPLQYLVPAEYSNMSTTPLALEIKADSDNFFEIALPLTDVSKKR